MSPPAESNPRLAPDWDAAPCALLLLDPSGRVAAANARFCEQTGHRREEVIGRLFWSDLLTTSSRAVYQTRLAPVLELTGALEEAMVDVRTAYGGRVPVLLNATRARDDTGAVIGTRLALLAVADRRAYEEELRRARDEAESARRADRRARRRLEVLARVGAALVSSTDVAVALDRLATVLAAGPADWCVVYVSETPESDELTWTAAHADPELQVVVDKLAALLPEHSRPASALRQVLARGEPLLLAEVGEAHRIASTDSPDVLACYQTLGLGSAMVAPIIARGETEAAIVVARAPGRPPFTDEDLADLSDLAARAGIVIDNLRRQAREHSNSVALQQALLTGPPELPGLQIATRYLPATNGNEIGGDWYDTFVQPDGSPVFVVGDVVGHDIQAAAEMGQLRGVLRTVGYLQAGPPAQILAHADGAARGLRVDVLATAIVARIETAADGTVTLRWSNAGHPPPVLLSRGGARLLDAAADRPLGLLPSLDRPRQDHQLVLEPGDTLLLYTDGLVERADEDLDTGLARLRDMLAEAAGTELDALCDLVVRGHRTAQGSRDDVALLAVRVG